MQLMKARLYAAILGSSLAVGFGIGFGLGVSDQPLELEATGTPLGSFVLRCNIPQASSPSLEGHEERLLWDDYIA